MQAMPFVGYVEYKEHCVIASNWKCLLRETMSFHISLRVSLHIQGLDMPSNGHGWAYALPRHYQKNNDKCARESMEKYSSGQYSKLEFLFV